MVRQGYNNAESVLVSSAMQADTVVPTQPSWSPLLIDSVVGYTDTANAVYAQPLWAHSVSTGLSNCNPCNMLVVAAMGGGLYAFNGGTSATGGGTNAGATVWSRNTRSSSGQNTTNYLWYDDCQGGTYSTAGPAAPFNIYPYTAGILSTPKIDRSANAIYVTSACSTNIHTSNTQVWYIHKVSLLNGQDLVTPVQITGSAPGSDGADDVTTNSPCSVSNPCIPFNPNEVLQRPALLELTSPSTLIYVAFGWGTLYEKEDAYHGWVFGYDQNLNQKFAFVTTAKGTTGNTDFPGCTPQCPTCLPYADGGCSPNSTCVVTGYHESANWCGHAGGIWMSGRGPAAATDANGVSHAYFAIGNGSFQQNATSASGPLLSPIQNWSNAVVDFTLSSSGPSGAPSEYFVPYGYTTAGVTPVQEPLGTSSYTYQGMSQNDFDLGTTGPILFDDLAGKHRLLSIDKAGYGYLLTQGNLCGSTAIPPTCYPGSSSGSPGFAPNDPGNVFPFQANVEACANQTIPASCHRITSMAFYKDGSPERLYVWPNAEKLAGLALSNNQAIDPPAGAYIGSNGSTVCGSGTTFTSWVIPGDTLTDTGSANPGQSVTVTAVLSDTQLNVSQAFTNNIGSCSSSCTCTSTPDTFTYNGYFVNPIYDARPVGSVVQYPGGALSITSNSGTDAVVWALGTLGVGVNTAGAALAYDAATLKFLWCSNYLDTYCDQSSDFTASLFTPPTVINGYVYVATSGITQVPSTSHAASTCNSSPGCYGVLVYSGH